MTDFKELKSKCDEMLGLYKSKEDVFLAKREQGVKMLESLRTKVIDEGSYLSSIEVSARDVRLSNVCDVCPSVYVLTPRGDAVGDTMLGVYRSEIDNDFSHEGFYAIPISEVKGEVKRFRDQEQILVAKETDLESALNKAREQKEKIIRDAIDLPEGITAFATDDIADFKVVLTSDKSWHPCSECDNMTIGRVVDLQGKSDEENSLLVKQVCDLILSLDKITGSCVIE